ncbi:hypothetical protein SARC_09186, partial [Sphaeroforma arctica JP610]
VQGVLWADPVPQEVPQGHRYSMDNAMAALSDLRSQLENERKETQKDLRKLLDKDSKRLQHVAPATGRQSRKQTRSRTLEDDDGAVSSGGDTDGDFKVLSASNVTNMDKLRLIVTKVGSDWRGRRARQSKRRRKLGV